MSLYKQPGSQIWWMGFTIKGYPRVREPTGETDFEEASRVEIRRKAEVLKQPQALTGRTWLNAITKWTDNKDPSLTELQSIQKFNKFFKDCQLSRVTADSIDAALSAFCTNPSTYNRHRARVLGILKLSKVVIDLPPRKTRPKTRMALTPELWVKLHAELPKHQQHMAAFALATGLRQSNVLQLTWDKVDLDKELVWVEAGMAKSKKAIGVPLSIEAINVLKTVKGEHAEFCFTYNGKTVSEIKTAFIAACIRAGVGRVDGKGRYTGFTWHGFRHTFATWHALNGTPAEVLQELGAWKDARMVRNYTHLNPGYLASFANNARKK